MQNPQKQNKNNLKKYLLAMCTVLYWLIIILGPLHSQFLVSSGAGILFILFLFTAPFLLYILYKFVKKIDVEKLSKKTYDYFNLDKSNNRKVFVFAVFFAYFLLFWVVPVFVLMIKNVDDLFFSLKSFFLIFKELLFKMPEVLTLFFSILTSYGYLFSDPLGFEVLFLYQYLIAPILVFFPVFIVHKILPKLKLKHLLIVGLFTMIFSIIYTHIYVLGFVMRNATFF